MFYYIPINPEQWKVGPLGVGRSNGRLRPYIGRDQQLYSFQQAVKEELKGVDCLPPGEYELHFYLWRNVATWETPTGKSAHRNAVDATNMQKALEDALQGVLITNDRYVKRVGSTIVEQGPDVVGKILIKASMWNGLDPLEIPDTAWSLIDAQPELEYDEGYYSPGEDIF